MPVQKIYIWLLEHLLFYFQTNMVYLLKVKELIAVDRTFKDISDIIGCNEIIYNDLDEIITCLINMNNEIKGFETSCLMISIYLTDIYKNINIFINYI